MLAKLPGYAALSTHEIASDGHQIDFYLLSDEFVVARNKRRGTSLKAKKAMLANAESEGLRE